MIRSDAPGLEVGQAGRRAPTHLPRPLGASAWRRCAQGAVDGRRCWTASSLRWPSSRGVAGAGHGKIAAIAAAEGCEVGSPSSVKRAMARRGLLQPVRYQAERRQFAAVRREVFVDPPARRNRVWQMDFTQFETTSEGTWRLCPVVDYATKVALACPVTAT